MQSSSDDISTPAPSSKTPDGDCDFDSDRCPSSKKAKLDTEPPSREDWTRDFVHSESNVPPPSNIADWEREYYFRRWFYGNTSFEPFFSGRGWFRNDYATTDYGWNGFETPPFPSSRYKNDNGMPQASRDYQDGPRGSEAGRKFETPFKRANMTHYSSSTYSVRRSWFFTHCTEFDPNCEQKKPHPGPNGRHDAAEGTTETTPDAAESSPDLTESPSARDKKRSRESETHRATSCGMESKNEDGSLRQPTRNRDPEHKLP